MALFWLVSVSSLCALCGQLFIVFSLRLWNFVRTFCCLVNKMAVCITLDAEAGVLPLFEKKCYIPFLFPMELVDWTKAHATAHSMCFRRENVVRIAALNGVGGESAVHFWVCREDLGKCGNVAGCKVAIKSIFNTRCKFEDVKNVLQTRRKRNRGREMK